jgi:hypothetical protein
MCGSRVLPDNMNTGAASHVSFPLSCCNLFESLRPATFRRGKRGRREEATTSHKNNNLNQKKKFDSLREKEEPAVFLLWCRKKRQRSFMLQYTIAEIKKLPG